MEARSHRSTWLRDKYFTEPVRGKSQSAGNWLLVLLTLAVSVTGLFYYYQERPSFAGHRQYTILPGDTLWKIGSDNVPNCGSVDPRAIVDQIKAENPQLKLDGYLPLGLTINLPARCK
jgi:hypothetical protein